MIDQSADTRLLALDRAVGLASTGRIEPTAIISMAEEFEDYLLRADDDSAARP